MIDRLSEAEKITLIKNVSVIIVAAYLLTRTQTYTAVIQKKTTFGRLLYSSDGHNLPYLLRQNSQLEQLRKTPGMALGAMENAAYGLETLNIASDDALILYTDGVTEAMDIGGNLYGETRLKHFLQTIPGFSAEAANRQIMAEIKRYADQTPQSDDIPSYP